MFILRRITEDGVTCHFEIGNSYDFYEKSHPEFDRVIKDNYGGEKPNGLYALIQAGNGHLFGLFEDHANYIMTENGKTFENVSF